MVITTHVTDLQCKIQRLYELATETSDKARAKQRDTYNTKARGGMVKVEDCVLVKRVVFYGKHKLAERWEQEPYTFIALRNGNFPVFTVRKQSDECHTRTLHRNLFISNGFFS